MDVTQPLLRPGGSARTRLLIDDRVVVVDALNGTEPVARATPAYGEGPENLGRRRETPHSIPVSPPAELLGRTAEIEEIEDALEDGETVVLSAGPGYGKTALLHHLAQTLPTESPALYPDGAVLLAGRGRTVEDLLFELFRACYEVPGRRPGAADLRRHLSVIQALILIDDVAEPARLGAALVDFAPYCRAVLATEAEPVGRGAFSGIVAAFGVVDAVDEGVADDDDVDDVEDSAAEEAAAESDVDDVDDVDDAGDVEPDAVVVEADEDEPVEEPAASASDEVVESEPEPEIVADVDDVDDAGDVEPDAVVVEADEDEPVEEPAASASDEVADSDSEPEIVAEDELASTQTDPDHENELNEGEDESKPAEGSSGDHD